MHKKNLDKNTIIKWVLSVVIVISMCFLIWYLVPYDGLRQGTEYVSEMEELPSFIMCDFGQDKELTQSFVARYGWLSEIGVVFFNTGDGMEGTLFATLTDKNGKIVSKASDHIDHYDPGEWTVIQMQAKLEKGNTYFLHFSTEGATDSPKIMVVNSAFDVDENQTLQSGDTVQTGGLAISYRYQQTYSFYLRCVFAFCMILTCLLCLSLLWSNHRIICRIRGFLWKDDDIGRIPFIIGFAMICGLILFVHLWKLGTIPQDVNIDEAGMSYDAWCMANFGVDRYLNKYPLYLINFGGGQSALYAYLVMLCYKIFGYSTAWIRIPAMINHFVILVFGAKIVHNVFSKRIYTFVYSVLCAILPVMIMMTQVGLDCNLMLGVSTAMLWFMISAFEKDKRYLYVISGLMAGLVLYTYALSYFAMIFFLLLAFAYVVYMKKTDWKKLLTFAIPLVILAIPLIAIQIINLLDLSEVTIGCFTLTKLPAYRAGELSIKELINNFCKIMKFIFWKDTNPFDSTKFLTLYWISIPFVIIGFFRTMMTAVHFCREKIWNKEIFILLWLFAIVLTGSLLGEIGPEIYKINAAYFAVVYLCVGGIVEVCKLAKNINWAKAMVWISAVAYLCLFGLFWEYYNQDYTKELFPNYFFQGYYTEAANTLQTLPDQVKEKMTYISCKKKEDLIYFCNTFQISPYDLPYEEYYDNDIQEYNHYFLTRKLQVNPDINYILLPVDKSFAMELEKNGFMVQWIDNHYLCYKM